MFLEDSIVFIYPYGFCKETIWNFFFSFGQSQFGFLILESAEMRFLKGPCRYIRRNGKGGEGYKGEGAYASVTFLGFDLLGLFH